MAKARDEEIKRDEIKSMRDKIARLKSSPDANIRTLAEIVEFAFNAVVG